MNEETNKKNGFGDYEGIVIAIGSRQEIGTKGFVKREMVVDADPTAQYPNPVKFTLKKDKCDILDSFKVGQRVKVGYVIEGRAWDSPTKGKQYFVDLVGLKLTKVDGAPEPVSVEMGAEEPDELPF